MLEQNQPQANSPCASAFNKGSGTECTAQSRGEEWEGGGEERLLLLKGNKNSFSVPKAGWLHYPWPWGAAAHWDNCRSAPQKSAVLQTARNPWQCCMTREQHVLSSLWHRGKVIWKNVNPRGWSQILDKLKKNEGDKLEGNAPRGYRVQALGTFAPSRCTPQCLWCQVLHAMLALHCGAGCCWEPAGEGVGGGDGMFSWALPQA